MFLRDEVFIDGTSTTLGMGTWNIEPSSVKVLGGEFYIYNEPFQYMKRLSVDQIYLTEELKY